MMETVPISIRVSQKLLNDIDSIAEEEGIDRATWIRKNLREVRNGYFEEMRKQLAIDYIQLRIDDEKYLRLSKNTCIPIDIMKAREQFLKNVISSESEK